MTDRGRLALTEREARNNRLEIRGCRVAELRARRPRSHLRFYFLLGLSPCVRIQPPNHGRA